MRAPWKVNFSLEFRSFLQIQLFEYNEIRLIFLNESTIMVKYNIYIRLCISPVFFFTNRARASSRDLFANFLDYLVTLLYALGARHHRRLRPSLENRVFLLRIKDEE